MSFNFRKIKGFLSQHKISTSIILVAVLLSIGAVGYERIYNKPLFNVPKITLKPKPKVDTFATLTGMPIDPANLNRRPLAVVIENHPDARPQSGYTKADIVFETLAEGGITRTLAIFQSQNADEIGPVRSARDYFIDWLSEFQAIFVHVGGSADALYKITTQGTSDLNQFNWGSYFWRSTDRFAPHNVYTTTGKLYDATKKAGYAVTSDNLKWLKFKKDALEKDRPASGAISIDFSSPLFVAGYTYNPKTNDYNRLVAGIALKDKATKEQVKAKNIIVQYESIVPGLSRAGEQKVNIATIGSGKAIFFLDGKTTTGKWEKTSQDSTTKLTDDNGNEIQLNPGQTWVEVVPTDATVTY